jgi:signal transduction histidine kinase
MRRFDPRGWPLAFKAPAVVVLFMVAISSGITHAVLDRLKKTQERHLAALSTTYLEGLASAVQPYVLREDIWEVYDAIDRRATLSGGFGRALVVVVNAAGHVIAGSDPAKAPLGAFYQSRSQELAQGQALLVDEPSGKAHGYKALVYQGRDIGRIYADYDIAHLLVEREDVLWTLLASNTVLTALLAALAYWIIRRMLSPLAVLSRHMGQTATGPPQPIALARAGDPDGEFQRLFRRYNSLIEAFAEREELARRLADEERLASLGRLASGMAHEINNPLGGLFNAIDTVKAHGDKVAVRRASLDLIERGLRGIRDVVRTALATYRADPDQNCLAAADIDDLRHLVRPEIERKGIDLDWRSTLAHPIELPATSVRQIVLNLLLNAVAAAPQGGRVSVRTSAENCIFTLCVEDDGPGLPPAAGYLLTGTASRPFTTAHGAGLGLWVTHRIASELKGDIAVARSGWGGARIDIRIPFTQHELEHAA